MTSQLVFIHGRSQEHKDPVALKAEWIDSLRRGLAKSDLELAFKETDIRFPYYGDTLLDLVSGADTVDEVVVRGGKDPGEADFLYAVLNEVRIEVRISNEQVHKMLDAEVSDRGPLNWEW